MSLKKLLIGFFLVVLSGSAFASVCSDFSFTLSPSSPVYGDNIRVTLLDTNALLPPNFWNPFNQAALGTEPGINLTGNNPQALNTSIVSYQWTVNYSSYGVWDINAGITGPGQPDCNLGVVLSLAQSDANLAKAVKINGSSYTGQAINVNLNEDFNFLVELTNAIGSLDATSVKEDPELINSSMTPGSYSFPGAIAGGSSSNYNFIVRPLNCGSQSVSSITTYNSNGVPQNPINASYNINVLGVDFSVIDVNFSDITPVEGQIIDVNAVIRNSGSKNFSGDFNVSFYLNSGLQATKTINGLNAGEQKIASFTLDTTGKQGSNTVLIKVDENALVYECGEGNNNYSTSLSVGSAPLTPNLSIQNVAIPSTASTGSNVSISWEITSVTSLNNINVKAYVDSIQVYSDTRNYSPSTPVQHSFSWIAVDGNHSIKLSADPAGIVAESSETDNNYSSNIIVSAAITQGGTATGGWTNPQTTNEEAYTASYASSKISEAEALKENIRVLMIELEAIDYPVSESTLKLIDAALKKLDSAMKARDEVKFFTAGELAVEARDLLKEAIALLPGIQKSVLSIAGRQSLNSVNAEGVDANALLLADYNSRMSNLFEFSRHATIYSLTFKDSGKNEFRTIVRLKVKSNALKALKNVEARETIPKTVAVKASELIGDFKVIEEDPVIAWNIDSINAGEEKELSYTIKKKATEFEMNLFPNLQTIISLSDEEKCSVMDFDDNNLCTIDSCELGVINHAPAADDENCLNGMPRQKTQPAAAAAAGVGPTGFFGLGASNEQVLLGLIILAVLLGAGFLKREKLQGFLSRQKGKKKGKPKAKAEKKADKEIEEAEDEGY